MARRHIAPGEGPSRPLSSLAVPKGVVVPRLRALPETSALTAAVEASREHAAGIEPDAFAELVESHRDALAPDALTKVDALVRHLQAGTRANLFDVFEQGPDLLRALSERATQRPERTVIDLQRAFSGMAAPRRTDDAGGSDRLAIPWTARLKLPLNAGTPLVMPSAKELFVCSTDSLFRVSTHSGKSSQVPLDIPGLHAMAVPASSSDGERVFFALRKQGWTAEEETVLVAANPTTHEELWRTTTPGVSPYREAIPPGFAHQFNPSDLTLSRDEKRLFHLGTDATLRCYDASAGHVLWETGVGGRVSGITVEAPDGKTVCVRGPAGIEAVDAHKGAPRWTSDGNPKTFRTGRMEFTPDGSKLLLPEADGVRALDAATGTSSWKFEMSVDADQGVVVTRDGGFAVIPGGDGRLHVLDPNTGAAQRTVDLTDGRDGDGIRLLGAAVLANEDTEAIVVDQSGRFSRVRLDDGTMVQSPVSSPGAGNGSFSASPDGRFAYSTRVTGDVLATELPAFPDDWAR